MTTFLDGPADGQGLHLHRNPLLLRVVIGAYGEVDAIDHRENTPADHETIHVYRRIGTPARYHQIRTGQRGGWYLSSLYKLNVVQPAEWQARDNESWQQWCREQTGAVSESSFL